MTDDLLVGRTRELALLERRLEAARAGHGASVLVEGGPFISRNNLASAFFTKPVPSLQREELME